MGKLLHFHRPDLCSFGSGGHYNLQVMWKQMDREIPKGNTDLYILSAACKWYPYAVRTLPVTSPLLCVHMGMCVCHTKDEWEKFVLRHVFVAVSSLFYRITESIYQQLHQFYDMTHAHWLFFYKSWFSSKVTVKLTLWWYDLGLQCSFTLPMRHEKWKWNNLSHTGPDFLSGQMSIPRNYKDGLLHFHCLRSYSKVMHRSLNKADFLILSAHLNHIRHTLWGRFQYHHQRLASDGS